MLRYRSCRELHCEGGQAGGQGGALELAIDQAGDGGLHLAQGDQGWQVPKEGLVDINIGDGARVSPDCSSGQVFADQHLAHSWELLQPLKVVVGQVHVWVGQVQVVDGLVPVGWVRCRCGGSGTGGGGSDAGVVGQVQVWGVRCM